MIKHFCDWCGKEINIYTDFPRCSKMEFPALLIQYENGKPTGEISLDAQPPHRNEYELCIGCIKKIWGLRHDQA